RLVALKVLRPEVAYALGPDRFRREIRVASSLQHPHILAVHDSGDTGGRLWFTMPYVDGESVRSLLAREHQVRVDLAVAIVRDVAQALQYAHDRGVVHRDVKPENILFQQGHAVIADFGIALSADERLTATGLMMGTPAYVSPEQAAAERDVDGRSDQYSLA